MRVSLSSPKEYIFVNTLIHFVVKSGWPMRLPGVFSWLTDKIWTNYYTQNMADSWQKRFGETNKKKTFNLPVAGFLFFQGCTHCGRIEETTAMQCRSMG